MSSGVVELRPVAVPDRIGQGTSVEQSRAIAQVQAMVIVAQQCPRSVPAAVRAMEEACRQIELAEQAFFRFPRAGEAIEGPSVHLARELARCWGNIEYGVTELRRDDDAAQSEILAFAWDLQTNTRSSAIFIAPHKRDTKQGVKTLTDMRDIYESNANNGARRVREAIFTVLPVWFRARAEKLCRETIQNGGGVPLATRIADAVRAFEKYRVGPARLAAKFGYGSVDDLTATDVAQLGVIFSSLQQGTVTVADEFPDEAARITPADLAPPRNPSPAATAPESPVSGPPSEPSQSPGDRPAAGEAPVALKGQVTAIWAILHGDYGYSRSEDDTARQAVAVLAGHPLKSLSELTKYQASEVLDQLHEWRDQARQTGERPRDILAADLASRDTDPRGEDGTVPGGE